MASNVTSTKRIDVLIDNVKVGQVVPVNTAGWQNWETKFINNVVIKDSQPKLLKLSFSGTEFNINWIEFISINTSSQNTELNNNIKAWYDSNNRQIQISMNNVMNQATVQVFNTLGQSFYHEKFNGLTNASVSVSNWPTGIYLVSVTNNNQRITTKLIIE
ncbi:MAG: T9SS type A sorting domain-containing protein [Draconibacterium sp.]|nr:T9SS type A sorting domain-containing protein [Draconibacterium sp.]